MKSKRILGGLKMKELSVNAESMNQLPEGEYFTVVKYGIDSDGGFTYKESYGVFLEAEAVSRAEQLNYEYANELDCLFSIEALH